MARRGAGYYRDKLTLKKRGQGREGNTAASTVRTQWGRIMPLSGRELEVSSASGREQDVRISFRDVPAIPRNDSSGYVYFLVDANGTEYEIDDVQTFPHPDARQEVYCRRINQ